MQMPWSKKKSAGDELAERVDKGQAATAGADGDGKEHDLQYWLDSGFLTLPRAAIEEGLAATKAKDATKANDATKAGDAA
jgi:hypothetical protein